MKYRVTFTESLIVEADDEQEAQSIAEEELYGGFAPVTADTDVLVEPQD